MTQQHLDLVFDLHRAHAAAVRRFDAVLGSVHGVGLNDLQLMHALESAPDKRLRRVDLATALGLTPSGATWILRPLIKRGLVDSEPDPSDARASYAMLTPVGRSLLSDALATARKFAKGLFAELDKDQLARIGEHASKLA